MVRPILSQYRIGRERPQGAEPGVPERPGPPPEPGPRPAASRRPRGVRAFDLALLRALRRRPLRPPAERALLAFTRAGEHGLLWQALCLAGALLDRRRRPAYLAALRTIVVAYLTNIALKYVVRRKRPALEDLPALSSTVTALSYPSAHTTTSFAAARALTRDCGLPRAPVYALATAMAASRVYVGVHYPSDVLAGAVLGTTVAQAAVRR